MSDVNAESGYEYDASEKEALVEALLFASGDPVKLSGIAQALAVAPAEACDIIAGLAQRLERSRRSGLLVREINGKFALCTKPEFHGRIAGTFEEKRRHGLSRAAYETLAVIAYNQNATKGLVEKLRGVNSDSSVDRLVERGLAVEKGRLKLPGRPMAYDVSDEFYRSFGVGSRKDLPDLTSIDPPAL